VLYCAPTNRYEESVRHQVDAARARVRGGGRGRAASPWGGARPP
jgi:hypothetical protein